MSASLQALGWGPGWPNCQTDKMVTVVCSNGLRLPFRREAVPLFAWLINETNRRGYDVTPGQSWSFACRQIRGSSAPSRHSWGLALDIRAPENPMIQGRLVSTMPQWLPGLWKAHGFGWGGDYGPNHWDGRKWVGSGPHRYDAMHVEVLVTPADVARITASLHSPTGPLKLSKTLHVGDKGTLGHPVGGLGDQIAHVQDLLHFYAVKYKARDCEPGAPDGNYGAKSGAAVLAFKARVHSLQVALGGHLTFHAPLDNSCGSVTLGALEYWDRA